MARSSDKRRTSIGVLFWIAFILLVLVIFLANRSNIEQVLESTGIIEVVRDRFGGGEQQTDPQGTGSDGEDDRENADDEPQVVIADDDSPSEQRDGASGDGASGDGTSGDGTSGGPDDAPGGDGSSADEDAVPGEPDDAPDAAPERDAAQDNGDAEQTRPRSDPAQRAPSPDPEKPNRRMAALYFIKVTDDGRTYPQRVVRPVYYASSPLTETVNALIKGPTGDELDGGLLNLIPERTELISAHVDDGVAYLNFNQAFRFNPLGAEGTVAQLLQIIYSSTEFSTVERVQFLVEGERVDYLGGDGIYVGEPLGRDAFSS